MPVKSLESFLFERGLVGSGPIDSLRNSTLGIDVDHYVSRLLTHKREQYLDAIGGFPMSLKMYIESDLQIFRENNITPIFIFSGSCTTNQLDYQAYYTAMAQEAASTGDSSNQSLNRTSTESILNQRHKAWTQWNNLMINNKLSYIDHPIPPVDPFRYNTTIETKRFQNDLIYYLIQNNIYYQVAPYCSWIQLAYLLQEDYIDIIYGPTDLLMLDSVDKFILGMEFPNKEYRFIDRGRMLSDFKCSSDEFVDICMAIGNSLQPVTLPPLQVYSHHQIFQAALDMCTGGCTNYYTYLLTNPLKLDLRKEISLYQKGLSSLKYMPVLKDNGRVEIFNYNETEIMSQGSDNIAKNVWPETLPCSSSALEPIPNDVHDFIQQKLPHEYNFYRSIGLIDNILLDTIATGVYPDFPPLDGGLADSYRKLVRKTVDDFKNKEINLLTQSINRYYQIKPIKHVKWFSPSEEIILKNRMDPSMFDKINHLIVKTDDLDRTFSINEFISVINESDNLSQDFIFEQVLFPNSVPKNKKIFVTFDLLSTNFLRWLFLMDFFEFDLCNKILKPTQWGKILLKFNELGIPPKYQEYMLILLVFFKMNVLSLSEDTKPLVQSALSQATLRSYPKEAQYILILTRVLALFQLNQKPSNYYGPIDKKTLIFSEHLRLIKQNMSELFQSILVSSLVSGEFDRLSLENSKWQSEIVGYLPFKLSISNTIMAMMWEFYLQKWLHNGQDKQDALSLISNTFGSYKYVPNLGGELKEAYQYLIKFQLVFQNMAKLGLIKQEEYELYENSLIFANNAFYN